METLSLVGCVCVCVHTRVACVYSVAKSCLTLCDLMDCSLPGPSAHGIFQARIWSVLPFPTPGDLPNPGLNPCLLHLLYWQADFTTVLPGKPESSWILTH